MLFFMFVITLFNIINVAYTFGIQYHWFSKKSTELYISLDWLGEISLSVLAALIAVIIATMVLLRFKKMSAYDQDFERGSMQCSIICSLVNVMLAVILMISQ